MAAVCEIDNCGVVAVGRCAVNGEAMCTSHRAMQQVPGGFKTIVDLCVSCQRAEVDERSRESKELERRSDVAQARVKQLAQRLDAAGATKSKYYHATVHRQGVFPDRSVEDPANHGYGWPVGEFGWKLRDTRPHSDGGSIEKVLPTYVTGNGELAAQGIQPRAGNPFEGPSALVGAWSSSAATKTAFWERVAAAIEALAVRYGATAAP